MPAHEAPCVELGANPPTPTMGPSPSSSEVSGTSSPEPHQLRPTPLFRALAMSPPEPEQPLGQEELERRVPGYRRIVIPRDLTLIELLKQSSGVTTDEEVLHIREAKLRVVAERVGLRRLHVLAPCLRSLTLDGSAVSSLRDLGIGLVHLKILSVNRCGLTCLDGVWGLAALRELYAAGNRLTDLHPLAALQKLHTLDLSENPISDMTRLWTLGVCTSLRKLTLIRTPASDDPEYRTLVASTLPMLIYLDERPLHNDIEDEMAGLNIANSESEDEEPQPSKPELPLQGDAEPGPSDTNLETQEAEEEECIEDNDENLDENLPKVQLRRRPATTECAGVRPLRPRLPPRPKTAHERPTIDAPTRLQILNTLMDDEWRCSGSKLTSAKTVCGNLAQALRRTSAKRKLQGGRTACNKQVDLTLDEATKALVAEIPIAPRLEDWTKFKEETGIDIDIDFNNRPTGDAMSALERLERIERETSQRLSCGSTDFEIPSVPVIDVDFWKEVNLVPTPSDSEVAGSIDGMSDVLSIY